MTNSYVWVLLSDNSWVMRGCHCWMSIWWMSVCMMTDHIGRHDSWVMCDCHCRTTHGSCVIVIVGWVMWLSLLDEYMLNECTMTDHIGRHDSFICGFFIVGWVMGHVWLPLLDKYIINICIYIHIYIYIYIHIFICNCMYVYKCAQLCIWVMWLSLLNAYVMIDHIGRHDSFGCVTIIECHCW